MSVFSGQSRDYPTCSETFVTLSLYHPSSTPDEVTNKLGMSPTIEREARDNRYSGESIRGSHWGLSSQNLVDSCDSEKHIAYILDQLAGHEKQVRELLNVGWIGRVFVFWVSASGHGGPRLSPEIMRRLVELNLPVDYDIYFGEAP